MAAPKTLLTGVDYWEFAMLLDADGNLRTSWFNGDECTVGITTFLPDGSRKRHRAHVLGEDLCYGGLMVAGVAGEAWLLQELEPPREGAKRYRAIRFDRDGVGPQREFVLQGRDAEDFYIPRIAITPDGSFASTYVVSWPNTTYVRVWDADGNPLTSRIELGVTYDYYSDDSHVLALANGRFLVAWKGNFDSTEWIVREVVIDGGQPTTTTTTTTLPGDPLPPMPHFVKLDEGNNASWRMDDASVLVTDGRQTWIASWLRWVPGMEFGAFVSVSNNSGRTWSGGHLLGPADDVAIAKDPDGQWLAAATAGTEYFGTSHRAEWRFWRSRDKGRTWTPVTSDLENGGMEAPPWPFYELRFQQLHLISEGHDRWLLTVVATRKPERRGDPRSVLVAARSEDDGRTWRWIRDDHGTVREWRPMPTQLVPLADDSLVLWRDGTLLGIDGDSLTTDSPRVLNGWAEAGQPWYSPPGFSAASDKDRTVIAAWASRSSAADSWGWDPDVVFSRTVDAGQSWSVPAPISALAFGDAVSDELPHVATNGRGDWLAAWRSSHPLTQTSPPAAGVLASYSSDDGQSWTPAIALQPQELLPADEMRVDAVAGGRRGPDGAWGLLWSTRTGYYMLGDELSDLWVQMTAPSGSCGDGEVSRDEDCDDGNELDGDGCDSNCTRTACGNGVLTAGELCDDGNLWPEGTCSPDCVPTFCGDGLIRWDTEICDDGNNDPSDACQSDCSPSRCGDGNVHVGVEACDDGNNQNGDGCDKDCSVTGCGNTIVTAGEACDDGNTDDLDLCRNGCIAPYCGDGVVSYFEECDDGNTVGTDDCRADCTLPECGDGVTHVGLEGCDDANAIDGDGCDRNCTPTGCGNGRLTRGEFCDDGNTADGDYCSADCSSFSDGCGDADASGEVTASDAQRVVSSAVGLASGCPRWACDVNGNGQVTAVDGSVVLRNSVGLQTEMRCRDRVIVRLASPILFGALQLRIDYSQTPGSFFDSAGPLRCTRLVPTLSAFSDVDGVLTLGFVSLTGVQGPVDLAECIFRRFAPPTADDFSVIIDDVSTPDFQDPEGPVEIELVVD